MNLNEQLRQAYEAGKRLAINEQRGMGPGGMGGVNPPKGGFRTSMSNGQMPPTPPRGSGDGSEPRDTQYFVDKVIEFYGQSVPPAPWWLDFDGDGVIGVNDLLFVLENDGATAG